MLFLVFCSLIEGQSSTVRPCGALTLYWRLGGGRMRASICTQQTGLGFRCTADGVRVQGQGSVLQQSSTLRDVSKPAVTSGGAGSGDRLGARQVSKEALGRDKRRRRRDMGRWSGFRARLDHPAPPPAPSDQSCQTGRCLHCTR